LSVKTEIVNNRKKKKKKEKVVMVRKKDTGQIYAMKIVNKEVILKDKDFKIGFKVQRNILMKLNHPFIVKAHYSFQVKEYLTSSSF